ncbi:hypothetical protein JZK55_15940 [Dissulfurispira thermophila]|uniref:histidine kinase n=2 Tax=root TaxID=1 RepID=A0A7G1H3F8_9BACT|nr:ATP-binding protein [Dissulfurispira thermophila]BCB96672.1 hypothetical protein JZK55_15940 [Dissulfurispira thermophila]
MKVKFFQRLNTRLSLLPLFIVLAIFIAGGIGFYIFGYSHFLRDFHKLHIINLTSDRKIAIDSWFQYYRTDIKDLSRLELLRDNITAILKDKQKQSKGRKTREALVQAQTRIFQLLKEKVSSKKYDALCLISMDGKVISSTQIGIEETDWSDRMFFKEAIGLKSMIVIGFGADAIFDRGIGFITPVFDMHDNMIALLYASVKIDELVEFLKIKNGLYKSEKTDVIDKDGNVVLTGEGIPIRKIRYNIHKDSRDIVQYKDGIFFYMADLEHAPFRLITMVKKVDVARPFNMLLIIYLSIACAIILLMVIQNAYLSKRLITKPVFRLINAFKSVAAGDMNVDAGKNYKGELLELKKAFDDMVEGLREWESNLRENIRTREQSILKSALLDTSHFNNESLTISQEESNICELLREVEDSVRFAIETKEIELVMDCQDIFINNPIHTDRQRLRQLLTILVMNAVNSTEVGTVTLLCSHIVKEDKEYAEITIADTGSGFAPEIAERIFEEFSYYPVSFCLSAAKKLTTVLGGSIDFESIYGKGSVFTVVIPIKL